jgi:TPR repeat protein
VPAPDATPIPTRTFRSPWIALSFSAALLGFLALPPVLGNEVLARTFAGVFAGLALWVLLLWALPARRRRGFEVEFVKPLQSHYVQAGVQLCIYAYWGWYWPQVYASAPLILAQIVFLYAFEALLTWSRGRAWRMGFGPLPVVFSTNLFLWFRDDWFYLQFLMIATCALGKEFVRWKRDGRSTHIFNPSAFGLGVFSIWLLASGRTTELTWGVEVATTLGFPPYIYALIFGLGLVVQYLFSVTLMTLSAMVALVALNIAYTGTTGVYQFVDTNVPIAVFLGLHLLMTDPATSPRTNVGRVLFGAFYGLGSFAFYSVLRDWGAPEFYDKLMTVPLLNLSVQVIDRVARGGWLARLERWQARFQPRRVNLVVMGLWVTLFVTLVSSGFVQAQHPGASLDFWRRARAEDRPRADENVVRLLQVSAERGSLDALVELGEEHLSGDVLARDEALATQMFADACRKGHLRGCANLVSQFLAVEGAQPGDLLQHALERLELACDGGKVGRPCLLIGMAYETGRGRPWGPARAIECYTRAIALGNVEAAVALVTMAARDPGLALDLAPAEEPLERACENGDAQACHALAWLHHIGRARASDESLSQALLEQACALGQVDACAALEAADPWAAWLRELRSR